MALAGFVLLSLSYALSIGLLSIYKLVDRAEYAKRFRGVASDGNFFLSGDFERCDFLNFPVVLKMV